MSRRTVAQRGLAAAALAGGQWFFGCSPRRATARDTVVFAFPQSPTSWLPVIAMELGLFRRRHVELTHVHRASGKVALQALLAGRAQVATAAETPLMLAGFARPQLRILATIGASHNDHRIVARRSAVSKEADLSGKRIATHQGAAAHFFLHLFLLRHDLAEDQVELSFASPKALPGQLVAGKVDAICTREPFLSKTLAELGDDAIVFEEPGLYRKSFHVVTTADYVQQSGRALRQVLRSLLDAQALLTSDPERAVRALTSRLGLPKSTVVAALSQVDLRVELDQALIVALEDEARWAMGAGLVTDKTMPNYLALIDSSVLRNVKPDAVTLIE